MNKYASDRRRFGDSEPHKNEHSMSIPAKTFDLISGALVEKGNTLEYVPNMHGICYDPKKNKYFVEVRTWEIERQGMYKRPTCLAFLLGCCNYSGNCKYSHRLLNPGAWNLAILLALNSSNATWTKTCQNDHKTATSNDVKYDKVFGVTGCSFWHDDYSEHPKSQKCSQDLLCRDPFCQLNHENHTRVLFGEVVAFLEQYKVCYVNNNLYEVYLNKDIIQNNTVFSIDQSMLPKKNMNDSRQSNRYYDTYGTSEQSSYPYKSQTNSSNTYEGVIEENYLLKKLIGDLSSDKRKLEIEIEKLISQLRILNEENKQMAIEREQFTQQQRSM